MTATVQRLSVDDAEAVRREVIELAAVCGRHNIAEAVQRAELVLEWNADRSKLDQDAWFAFHTWQAWLPRRWQGWLYAPGDGSSDAELQRRCHEGTEHRARS